MATIRLPNNWQPRKYQLDAWTHFERGGKRGVLVCHRRWGKDDLALHLTATKAFERVATYWHMLPYANQGRKAIWQAVNPHTGKRRIDEAFPEELRKRTNDAEMFIEFVNGSMWHVVGSDNYNSLIGSPPAGIIFSEWAIADPQAWAYLQPILVENNGWAIFIYTSRGRNHGHSLYQLAQREDGWFSQKHTADDTPVYKTADLEQIRKDLIALYGQDQGEALFQQEYYCSFEAAVLGAYYGRQLAEAEQQGRITKVPYDPAAPVHTAWDLGIGDETAIWFVQVVGREVHWIDYHAAAGEPLQHYAKIIKDKSYVYGDHYLPHDAKARELGTGKSRVEMLENYGIKATVVPRGNIDDGINEFRTMLSRSWIDEVKCARGLEALRAYRAEYDETKRMLKQKPVHDWSCHGADAARTFAMGYKGPVQSIEINMPAVAWDAI